MIETTGSARRHRHAIARALTIAALAAGLLAPSAAGQVVLEAGHVDAVAPTFAGGQLIMKVKDGTGSAPVFRDPGDVLFRVRPQAEMTVPPGLPPAFAFMGAPGSVIWLLPQVQSDNHDVVWTGWSSEAIPAGQFAGNQLQWRLVGVDGPGPVQLYATDTFGSPRVFFDSADGLPDTEPKATGTHSHYNWVFHAAGLHRLRFEVSGTPTAGAPITTGPVEYRFEVVGDEGGQGGEPGGGQGGGASDPKRGAKLDARVAAARASGRTLTLRLRVTHRSRVAVAVLRGKRVVARSKARVAGVRQRRLRVKLNRRLPPGRYRMRVTVRSGARKVVRRAPLRVPARKRGRAAVSAMAAQAATDGGGATAHAMARAAASGATVLDDGHVDYGAKLVGGKLTSLIKDGTKSANDVVWREPSETVFHVVGAAETDVPRGGGLDFVGRSGSAVWMIPQVQRQGVLWAGWNTEDPSLRSVRGAVSWRLSAVDGPGEVSVFQTGSFGQPDVIFSSADGLPDSHQIPLGVHAHGNWAFTAEGVYRLRFEMAADVAGRRQTDTETLTVVVGNSDPSTVDPAAGSGGPAGSGSGDSVGDAFVAGDGGDDFAGDGGSDGGEDLPHTGAELVPVTALGVALLALGVALRRRMGSGRATARP